MEFSNVNVRRRDRLLDEKSARELLASAIYGVLSMQAENGGGYAVPVSYVWDGQETIYFHCATEGRKLRCLALCSKVSLCVIGETQVVSDKFTTGYESIILECTASVGLPEEERMKALELILDKFSPKDKTTGMKYAKNSFHKTEIVKLVIGIWSGKAKKLK